MSDRYRSFTGSLLGHLFTRFLGLPNPTQLERWRRVPRWWTALW